MHRSKKLPLNYLVGEELLAGLLARTSPWPLRSAAVA
jgi:hypothetical protein